MKFIITTNYYWQATLSAASFLIYQNEAYAGVSDYLARETIIKHIEENQVANISQYSNLTYLIELIALGLVATALLAVTFSVYTRLKSGKREQQKILSLRRSAEQDKKIFDATITEINNIGKRLQEDSTETDQHIDHIIETANNAKLNAENIAALELDMKQLVDGTTERMVHIQEHWEQQLKDTTDSISQINSHLHNNLEKTAEQSKQAESLLGTLSSIRTGAMDNNQAIEHNSSPINAEIKATLDLTLNESKELLSQIRDYQKQAKEAFSSFTNTLGGFESQAHEQFDEVFNTADIARQELNANLDESREYMKIFRKDKSQKDNLILQGIDKSPDKNTQALLAKETSEVKESQNKGSSQQKIKDRKDRPIIGMNDAEDLTDASLIKSYGEQPIINPDLEHDDVQNKNLVSLFSKLRHHGS